MVNINIFYMHYRSHSLPPLLMFILIWLSDSNRALISFASTLSRSEQRTIRPISFRKLTFIHPLMEREIFPFT